jgi:hypothetical protein
MLENRTDPSDLLFNEPLGDDGSPLFKSRSELAQFIRNVPNDRLATGINDFATRGDESLRAYLSQVLQSGASPRSRPLSKNLELVILAACAERLSKTTDIGAFTNRFREAFEFLKSAPDPLSVMYVTAEDFEKSTENARHHVIFALQPAETTASKCADNIRDEMIHKLCLAEDLSDGNNFSKIKTTYEFYVPSEAIAKDFWFRLYGYLSKIKKLKFAGENLTIINDKKEQKLSISVADVKDCSFSVLVLDPRASDRRGFHLYYHRINDADYVSLARISSESLSSWYEHTYLPYSLQSVCGDVQKEILWKDLWKCSSDKNIQEEQ